MKKIVVFQHVAYEILGTLHPLIKEAGLRIRYLNFDRHRDARVTLSSYDGLVILGGPMSVWEKDKHPHLTREVEYIQEAMQKGKPVLGICLGAQLIAEALGAEVKRAKTREIGWYDLHLTEEGGQDPVLGTLSKKEKIFQWHQDTFSLPKGATWLAKSDACHHQAFRHGEKTYGFQFHLEVDKPMIDRWLALPAHAEIVEKTEREKIQKETEDFMTNNLELSRKVFSKYLDLFCTKRKCTVLGSKSRTEK